MSYGSFAATRPVNDAVNCTKELKVVDVAAISTPFVPTAYAVAPDDKLVKVTLPPTQIVVELALKSATCEKDPIDVNNENRKINFLI